MTRRALVPLIALMGCAAALSAEAQGVSTPRDQQGTRSANGGDSGFVTPEFYPAPPGLPRGSLSDGVTGLIVRDLSEARDFCIRSPRVEYVIDCLSEEYGRIAEKMPRGDYEAAKSAVAEAARGLGALAGANADPRLPRARLKRPGGAATPPLTPVRSTAVNRLNAAAAEIVEEAETVLLRAAERSDRRRAHYQRIAAAIGSTKVLLRAL
ncbi:hypothetical protein [Rhodovulum marinum]|uniref:Uncharacterized protein n=1 Tax=Rhodovulum marinum TaxID=320662 RepID=A0A4R2Q307_9RHOB|nr:hypothetical protein [Rhodovulum marinum]TCP42927.1 hypothetical protein EV662_102118 [Rhodovulum marinum]